MEQARAAGQGRQNRTVPRSYRQRPALGQQRPAAAAPSDPPAAASTQIDRPQPGLGHLVWLWVYSCCQREAGARHRAASGRLIADAILYSSHVYATLDTINELKAKIFYIPNSTTSRVALDHTLCTRQLLMQETLRDARRHKPLLLLRSCNCHENIAGWT